MSVVRVGKFANIICVHACMLITVLVELVFYCTDKRPNLGDLASFPREDGMGMIRIIDSISNWEQLADRLLKEDEKREDLLSSTENKAKYTLTVLYQWLLDPNPKVPHTWESLLHCLCDARAVEESYLQDIRANLGLE